MATSFESKIKQAIDDRIIPGAVLIALSKSKQLFSAVHGLSSLEPGAEKPLELNTIFPLMSLTKLPTTLAVLQLVEQGKLDLDADVADRFPALAAQKVLTGLGADGSSPTYEDRRNPITLRHLLTHSAGLAYDFLNPTVQKWQAASGNPAKTSGQPEERFVHPLLFQPGEGWEYSPGVDYAGRLVELVSGQSLDAYLKQHVFRPVGAADLTFFPGTLPGADARVWRSLSARDPGSGRVVHTPAPFVGDLADGAVGACLGGQGLYGSVAEYAKVLASVLRDDGRIVSSGTAALMFRPHLDPGAKKALVEVTRHPDWIVGDIPDTGEYDWGYGGLLVDGDSHPWRKKGAMLWSGAFNLTWVR
jgi:CubicO group peptidase (beta-lactamase class C family)